MKCCVSTDVGTWTNWLTFVSDPEPDYSPDAGTGLISPISYALQRGILLRRENPTICIGRPSLQRRVVLKWFYSPRAVGTTLSEVHALHRVPFEFLWVNRTINLKFWIIFWFQIQKIAVPSTTNHAGGSVIATFARWRYSPRNSDSLQFTYVSLLSTDTPHFASHLSWFRSNLALNYNRCKPSAIADLLW